TIGSADSISARVNKARAIVFPVSVDAIGRFSQSERIGASGKAIAADLCRHKDKDDVGATLIGANLRCVRAFSYLSRLRGEVKAARLSLNSPNGSDLIVALRRADDEKPERVLARRALPMGRVARMDSGCADGSRALRASRLTPHLRS